MNSTDRKFAIGCVILVALGFLGTFAIFKGALKLVDKGKTLVKSTLAEQQRLRAIEGSWAPPTEKLEASWFPAEIGEWKRSSAELLTGVPDLGLNENGAKGIYQDPHGETMDVFIVDLTKGYEGDVFEKVRDHLRENRHRRMTGGTGIAVTSSSSSRQVRIGNRSHIVTNGAHTRLWLVNSWLFAFRPSAAEDPEKFAAEFLKQMQTARPQSVDEPLEKEPAEQPK